MRGWLLINLRPSFTRDRMPVMIVARILEARHGKGDGRSDSTAHPWRCPRCGPGRGRPLRHHGLRKERIEEGGFLVLCWPTEWMEGRPSEAPGVAVPALLTSRIGMEGSLGSASAKALSLSAAGRPPTRPRTLAEFKTCQCSSKIDPPCSSNSDPPVQVFSSR